MSNQCGKKKRRNLHKFLLVGVHEAQMILFFFLTLPTKLYDFISIYTYEHTYKHILILIILTPLSYEALKGREFLYIDFVYPVIIRIVYIIGTQKYL